METDFKDKNLIELYEKGKNRKFKFIDERLYKKFVERINRIVAADNINDLRFPPSNHFEKLEGFDNRFSIRLDKKIRLEFEIDFDNGEKTYGKVCIIDLSKHYK